MGRFYRVPELGKQARSWLYSERGVMSYMTHYLLRKSLDVILHNAVDLNGVSLIDRIRMPTDWLTLAEFDLGNEGFGCPDGGLYLEACGKSYFIFIEAKAVCFSEAFENPELITSKGQTLVLPGTDRYRACSENIFNSSINGQIELRRRFVNAFLASIGTGSRLVSECCVQLPEAYTQTDRFYWRLGRPPVRDKTKDWRRVEMGRELSCLYELLSGVEKFLFLAISNDAKPPINHLQRIRLFDANGRTADKLKHDVYWMPYGVIEESLERLPAKGSSA